MRFSTFLPPSIPSSLSSKPCSSTGAAQPQVNLKKLNWKRQNLNHSSLARSGGAIWQDLPKVEIPRDKFSHLFAQRAVVKLEKEGPVSGG